MLKAELAYRLAKKAGISYTTASQSITILFEEITRSLVKGEDVSIKNFGRFISHDSPPRKARDIWAGTGMLDIPAKRTVKFHVSPAIKRMMNDEETDA